MGRRDPDADQDCWRFYVGTVAFAVLVAISMLLFASRSVW
jgi:hypothetical protein